MGSKVKAILLDVDGTLTNDKKVITPRTREALLACQERGVTLVLASGRTQGGLARYAADLDLAHHGGVLVCYNGAKSVNCETGDVYFEQAMTVEQGQRVIRHMLDFDVSVVVDHGAYMHTNDAYFTVPWPKDEPWHIIEYEARSNNFLICEQADLASFCDWRINKILTAGAPAYLEAHHEEMAAPFEGELTSMFTAPYYFEFTPLGVDKTRALKDTFEVLGIAPEEVISFGDAQNDLSMIEWAGVGVAMGNATDVVKEHADFVCGTNNEDGIADALATLVL